MCSYTTPNGHWTPPESDMFPFHRCAMGAEHCCCKNAAEIHAEVINSDVRPSFSQQSEDDPGPSNVNVAMDISFTDQLAPVEEEESGPSPKSPTSPSAFSAFRWRKMTEMSHMESDYEIMRGIPLHRALHSELWTSPHEIQRRNRSSGVWALSTKVSSYDMFLSHTWKTKGRWKVLALMMQTGWPHALLAWVVGLTAMLFLRAFDVVGGAWGNGSIWIDGTPVPVVLGPWIIISAGAFLVAGLLLSPYLPLKTQVCFLDVACIHQGRDDMFERGLYTIGGCLTATKELRVLYSPEYLSSLWCVFELVGFRKAHPEGKLTISPLFVERSAAICAFIMWCAALAAIAGIALTDSSFRERNVVVVFMALFLLPVIFLVHALRHSYREKGRLIFDLNSFDVDTLVCHSDFDRAFILSAIDAWYGSREAFKDFVRSDLREELLSLLPSPHLPCAYAALILSSQVTWILDLSVCSYKAGADIRILARNFLAYLAFILWSWCAFNGLFYLSDRTSESGRTRLLDWFKTLGVAGVIFLWTVISFAVVVGVTRQSDRVVGFFCYLAFSMMLPFLILDTFKVCRRHCPKQEATRL